MIGLNVADVMTSNVVSISQDNSIDDAFELLLRHNVSGLPVVDEENRVIGILSERDLLGILDNPDTAVDQVRQYASMKLMSIAETAPLHECLDIFLHFPMRRLPVVDEKGHLKGVVSRRDLIRAIRDVRSKVACAIAERQAKKCASV